MPRSGTTLIFEGFCRHPLLGWPTNYTEHWPRRPWLNLATRLTRNSLIDVGARKGQYGRTLPGNRFLPQPAEAYPFWNHYLGIEFARRYLLDDDVTEPMRTRMRSAVGQVLRWQGRPRFAAKLTGPSRARFLRQLFPDCKFIHVIRDGRAVVHSLLNVQFWWDKGGGTAPFWEGGFPEDLGRQWKVSGRDPGVLAALQWKHIVGSTDEEGRAMDRASYAEIRYEDFLSNPERELSRLYRFCDLPPSRSGIEYLRKGPALRNMNDKYLETFDSDYVTRLAELMQPVLGEHGYR